jgi:hypothetical protein
LEDSLLEADAHDNGEAITVGELRFASTNSFGVFMEGLRALQLYGDESAKPEPRSAMLDRLIHEAVDRFADAVAAYPDDVLPRYYLGVAETTYNEHKYVQRLAELSDEFHALGQYFALRDMETGIVAGGITGDIKARREEAANASEKARHLDAEPWLMLRRAARQFEYLLGTDRNVGKAHAALQRAAAYNLAEVYGRLGTRDDLRKALRELERIPALPHRLPPLRKVSWWARVSGRLRAEGRWAFTSGQLRRLGHWENTALELQAKTLELSVTARLAVQRFTALDVNAPSDPEVMKCEQSLKRALDRLDELGQAITRIPQRELSPAFRTEVEADYWTKYGYLMYEVALTPGARKISCAEMLASTEQYLMEALRRKTTWNPAQVYLALVYRVHSGAAAAMNDSAAAERYSSVADSLFSALGAPKSSVVEPPEPTR